MTPLATHPGLVLLPEGAVWLEESHTLIVADVHLGKSAAFRARGLPVPEGDNARDLARLLELSAKHQARRLIIAGDLFHSAMGMSAELESMIDDFLTKLRIPCHLVIGNHDANLKHLPASLDTCPLFETDGLRIIHDPAHAASDCLHLAGHWHPVVKIPDGRRTSLRLPCFLLRENLLILPSFGSFTGGAIIQAKPGDRHFVPLRDQVIELPSRFTR